MQKHFFWLKWDQPFKIIASFLFVLLIAFIITSLVLLGIGAEGLIGWHTFSQKAVVDIISTTVDVGPFSFPYTEHLFIIKEFVTGGEMPNTVFEKEVLLLLVMGLLALIITLFTYFHKWLFLIMSSTVFFFIILMHPEMLQLADVADGWILGAIFFLFIGPAYYFQAFNKNVSFLLRLLAITSTVGIFLFIAISQSGMAAPLNALFSYGILAPYMVVILFILLVGHEIVNGFAIVIASKKDEPNNNRIKHFLAITFIYLLNVLFSYLQITHVIRWDFITVSPIILLAIAALLGVWGISQRYVLYKKANPDQQIWVLFYLALAVMAFATISFLMYSMEDPMLKIIGDFIIFTQLSLGAAFMLYIVYNFSSIIEKGHPIKNILYKPQNLPHVTYRLVGIVILTALVLMRDVKYPSWYSLGGFYNSIAGYFEDQGNEDVSKAFYEKGAELSKKNHKSNYKLGMIQIDSDHKEAIIRFELASARLPSAQSFVNKANLEFDDGGYFQALFTMQNGVKELPKSNQIQNNLGLHFNKSKMLDSAWHYFKLAKDLSAAKNNAIGFAVENNFLLSSADSAFLFAELNTVGLANATALRHKPQTLPLISGDNMITAALLNNMLINGLVPYTESAYQSLVQVIDSTKNPDFAEELNYAMALYELRNERVSDALLRLQKLTSYGSDKQSTYFEAMGLINLENGSFTEAERFFYLATEAKQVSRNFYLPQLALAQTESGYLNDAIITWKQIVQEGNPADSLKAIVMNKVISSIINSNDSINSDDLSLYLKARYQRLWTDEFEVKLIVDRITDISVRNSIALELAIYYFDTGNTTATKTFYDLIELEDVDDLFLESLLYFNIRMAYAGLIPNLEEHLENFKVAGFKFGADKRLEKQFFESDKESVNNDFAQKLATQNPYFAEGVVWAASYFKEDVDDHKSYNILQEALDKNPDNRLLLEAYILEAVDRGLEEYAINSLQYYRELFPGEQFYSFERTVLERKAKFDNWDMEE